MITQLFAEAHKRGSIAKNSSGEEVVHFNAQVILEGGTNIGVGSIAWVNEKEGVMVLRSVVQNPKNPSQTIAAETYFSASDVQTISVQVATAESKRSSILTTP